MTETQTETPAAPTLGAHARRTLRHVAAITVGILVGIGLAFVVTVGWAVTVPCESDDGSSDLACYWDADTHGDGQGDDFVSVGYGRWIIY